MGNGPSDVKRILIVDDHPVVRSGLREMLSHDPGMEVCGEAADVREALRLTEELTPDLVIVDISLKDSNGLDFITRVRASGNGPRLLVASMHDDALFAERALRAGAMGYVSKGEMVERIHEAVQLVLSGHMYVSPEMTQRMLVAIASGGEVRIDSPIGRLSNREIEVFEAMGRGRTTREIAAQMCVSMKTVQAHRENIKRKIGTASFAELIQRSSRWVLEGR